MNSWLPLIFHCIPIKSPLDKTSPKSSYITPFSPRFHLSFSLSRRFRRNFGGCFSPWELLHVCRDAQVRWVFDGWQGDKSLGFHKHGKIHGFHGISWYFMGKSFINGVFKEHNLETYEIFHCYVWLPEGISPSFSWDISMSEHELHPPNGNLKWCTNKKPHIFFETWGFPIFMDYLSLFLGCKKKCDILGCHRSLDKGKSSYIVEWFQMKHDQWPYIWMYRNMLDFPCWYIVSICFPGG